jgi:hypothetical protein
MPAKPHVTVTTETCGNTAEWSDLIMEHFGHQVNDSTYARAAYGSPTLPFTSYTDNIFEDEQPAMLEMPMSSFHGYDTQLIGGMGLADYITEQQSCKQEQTMVQQAPNLTVCTALPHIDAPSAVVKTEPEPEDNTGAAALDTTLPPASTTTTTPKASLPAAPTAAPARIHRVSDHRPNPPDVDASADTATMPPPNQPTSPTAPTSSPPAPGPSSPKLSPKLGPDQAVLVAKILTKSDASSKRVILPRVSVEANLPWIVGVPNYQLAVFDTEDREWKFIVKSWSNGENPKPVYVVEQISEYMRIHRLGPGDAVGIVGDSKGRLVIMANTPEIRDAALRPQYSAYALQTAPKAGSCGASDPADSDASHTTSDTLAVKDGGAGGAAAGASLPTLLHSQQGGALAIHSNGYLLCPRTPGCNRPAGHQGWCSGHKGFKRRSSHK